VRCLIPSCTTPVAIRNAPNTLLTIGSGRAINVIPVFIRVDLLLLRHKFFAAVVSVVTFFMVATALALFSSSSFAAWMRVLATSAFKGHLSNYLEDYDVYTEKTFAL